MPRVSILMPMYNAADTIENALRSLLSQDFTDFEVVVVDDASTDGSADRVRKIGDSRIRIVPGAHKGIAAAANTGLETVQGDILMRCDADDRYAPGRLAWQVAWLDAHPEFGAVTGYVQSMDMKGRPVASFDLWGDAHEVTEDLRQAKPITHFNAWAVRTKEVRAVNGWRTFFRCSEDLDLEFRLGGRMRVFYEPCLCYMLRIRDSSVTHLESVSYIRFFREAAVEFQRQRLSGREDDLALGHPPEPEPDPDGARLDTRGQIQGQLIGQAWRLLAKDQRLEALMAAARAIRYAPWRAFAWRNLVVLAIKSLLARDNDRD